MISAALIPRDWFDWTTFGLAWMGLVLTLWAVRQATGAKKAAQLAREAIRRHDAEADFGALAKLAQELHNHVERGRMTEARMRTTDLRVALAEAMGRHSPFLILVFRDLEDKLADLKIIADGLNRGPGALSREETIRLLRTTGAILELLARQSGKLRFVVDKGAPNG